MTDKASRREARRRAKGVTPETEAESQRLARLWETRPHPTQAEFGETYGIGNQSAVGQFLRGDIPLSLKAARGFAIGLGCDIEEFSPRLAKLIQPPNAAAWPFSRALLDRVSKLNATQLQTLESVLAAALDMSIGQKDEAAVDERALDSADPRFHSDTPASKEQLRR